jgi:hypothetical protein
MPNRRNMALCRSGFPYNRPSCLSCCPWRPLLPRWLATHVASPMAHSIDVWIVSAGTYFAASAASLCMPIIRSTSLMFGLEPTFHGRHCMPLATSCILGTVVIGVQQLVTGITSQWLVNPPGMWMSWTTPRMKIWSLCQPMVYTNTVFGGVLAGIVQNPPCSFLTWGFIQQV